MASKRRVNDIFAPDDQVETKTIFDQAKLQSRWTAHDYMEFLKKLEKDGSDDLINWQMRIITRRMLISPAFVSLSPRATKLLMLTYNVAFLRNTPRSISRSGRKPDGDLIGKPFLCPFNLCKLYRIGTNGKQIKDAFRELIDRGFIDQIGNSHINKPNVYAHSYRWRGISWDDIDAKKLIMGAILTP